MCPADLVRCYCKTKRLKQANNEITQRLLRNVQNVWNAQSLIRKTKTKSDGDKKYAVTLSTRRYLQEVMFA